MVNQQIITIKELWDDVLSRSVITNPSIDIVIQCPLQKPRSFLLPEASREEKAKLRRLVPHIEEVKYWMWPRDCEGVRYADGSRYKDQCVHFRGYTETGVYCTVETTGFVPFHTHVGCRLCNCEVSCAVNRKVVEGFGSASIWKIPLEECRKCTYNNGYTLGFCNWKPGCGEWFILKAMYCKFGAEDCPEKEIK